MLLNLLVLLKVPSYPLHFWLPEAHVESTWSGSVILACVILKYSLFCWLAFMLWSQVLLLSTVVSVLAGLSLLIGIGFLAALSDIKKLGAYLSVVHMNIGQLYLAFQGQFLSSSLDAVWFAHSVLAFAYFTWFGITYSASGSRSLQTGSSSPVHAPLLMLAALTVLLLNLAIPLGPLYVPDLVLLAALSGPLTILAGVPCLLLLAALPIVAVLLFSRC